MKRILTILTIIFFINCSTQIKVNKGKDVEIIEMSPPLPDGKFLIKNNTSDTYIIDPLGFWGKITYLENDNPAPLTIFGEGSFYRYSEAECRRDLIILKPYETIESAISLARDFSGSTLDIKKISTKNSYSYVVKSLHNRYTATGVGCENYISGLEKQGYKVLEDSINAKFPIPLDFLDKK